MLNVECMAGVDLKVSHVQDPPSFESFFKNILLWVLVPFVIYVFFRRGELTQL